MEPFNFPPLTPAPRNWLSAPPVVKGWAYQLSWLAIAIAILGIVAVPFAGETPAEKVGGVIFYVVLLAFFIWLNRGLKKECRRPGRRRSSFRPSG